MSIPITCQTHPHKDWLFYILYCGDASMIVSLIHQCIQNLVKNDPDDAELPGLLAFYRPDLARDSLFLLRAKLLILLDLDEYTRRELVQRQTSRKGPFGPVPVAKANRFYQQLHTVILPQWVSDETKTLATFISDVRMAYLVS